MKKQYAIHKFTRPVKLTKAGWEYKTQERRVRVLAQAEGWAMVRYLKGTYCVPQKELSPEAAEGKEA